MSSDRRTRLTFFATGITGVAANIDPNNDVDTGNGVLANLAESTVVEARTSSGQIFRLTVEYAGRYGPHAGFDQVNVLLPPELAGCGTIELSLIVGNGRSNVATATIR
jgi:uncharacterized protein (TIGR03437 family)